MNPTEKMERHPTFHDPPSQGGNSREYMIDSGASPFRFHLMGRTSVTLLATNTGNPCIIMTTTGSVNAKEEAIATSLDQCGEEEHERCKSMASVIPQ